MHAKDIAQSHWVGFLFLVPFLVMLAVHRFLGLSDALMIQTPPGEREAHTFNLVMVAVFYLGIAAFVAHAGHLAGRSRLWLYGKLCFWQRIGVGFSSSYETAYLKEFKRFQRKGLLSLLISPRSVKKPHLKAGFWNLVTPVSQSHFENPTLPSLCALSYRHEPQNPLHIRIINLPSTRPLDLLDRKLLPVTVPVTSKHTFDQCLKATCHPVTPVTTCPPPIHTHTHALTLIPFSHPPRRLCPEPFRGNPNRFGHSCPTC